MKICLVCSSGGHFFQLYCLKAFWQKYQHVWITFPGEDTRHLLDGEKVYWAYSPTNRSIKNFLLNLNLALRLLRRETPDVVISTGAGVGVPFLLMGRLLGIKTIYIESVTRVHKLSLSARLVYPFVHEMLVQWPELTRKYRKARFEGQVL